MRVEHGFALCAGEVPEAERPVDACVAVLGGGGLQEVHPLVDEGFGVGACRAEVDELDLSEDRV